jgi:hypothetical protein
VARNYNIKWSDKDERELKRLVKNFNAKIKRLEDKEPFLKDSRPKRISYKDLKENIATRKDLNRELKSIERFTKRGAEAIRTTKQGVITTEWQFKEASIMQRIVTTKRRKKRENVPSWKQQDSQTLFDKPKPDAVSPKGFDNYLESLRKEVQSTYDQAKKEAYLENYIKSSRDQLGVHAGPIIDLIRSMPLDQFVENSLSNPFLSIEMHYTEAGQQELADRILEEWRSVI